MMVKTGAGVKEARARFQALLADEDQAACQSWYPGRDWCGNGERWTTSALKFAFESDRIKRGSCQMFLIPTASFESQPVTPTLGTSQLCLA